MYFYDEWTEAAVRQFQLRFGLSPSGVADTATLDVTGRSRCGVPEGILPVDPSEKFAFGAEGSYAPGTHLTWSLLNNPSGGLSKAAAQSAIGQAFATWGAATALTFQDVTPATSASIRVQFGPLPPNVLGSAPFPNNGNLMTFSNSVSWVNSPGVGNDIIGIAMHEIGHALGLAHTSISSPKPVMWPQAAWPRALTSDDMVVISVLSDSVTPRLPGGAIDIASANAFSFWKIDSGTPDGFGNHGIFQLNGSTWVSANGAGTRITIDSFARPWVVALNASGVGLIFRYTTTVAGTGSWTQIGGPPGGASDIAAGIADAGAVWAIGNGNGIFKGNSSGSWTQANGAAVRIAVTPSGVPWVVNASGNIFRRVDSQGNPSNGASTGNWQLMPGIARDIAVSPDPRSSSGHDGYVWVIGNISAGSGNFGFHLWNEQAQGTLGGPPAPFSFGWLQSQSGSGVTIGATSNGVPIVLNSAGSILASTR